MPRLRRIAVALVAPLLLLVVGVSVAPASAQPYVLQPGDTVRVAITELPSLAAESTIDIDGNVQVPRLGLVQAAGKSLAELQAAISVMAAGQTIPLYTADGERRQVALVGTEILVEITAYRPIYVTGDVARPGEVPFKPGMSVRSALATVGGISTVPVLFEQALTSAPGLQSEFQTLSLEHASAVVRLWGIDATLSGARNPPAELPVPVLVGPGPLERLFAIERERVALALAQTQIDRTALTERLAYLEERVARLNEALANSEEAFALEEEDLARVRELNERGLTAASRLSDARQTLLLVSTRVLSVQDTVARFTLERDDVAQSLATFEQRFAQPLLAERSEVISRVWRLESQLAAARQRLELNGQTVEAFGVQLTPEVTMTVVRSSGETDKPIAVTLATSLRPGDILDVDVEYDYAALGLTRPSETASAPSPLPATPARDIPQRDIPERDIPERDGAAAAGAAGALESEAAAIVDTDARAQGVPTDPQPTAPANLAAPRAADEAFDVEASADGPLEPPPGPAGPDPAAGEAVDEDVVVAADDDPLGGGPRAPLPLARPDFDASADAPAQ